MSKISSLVKSFLETYSQNFKVLRYVPYSFRLGKIYSKHKKLIQSYASLDFKVKRNLCYQNLKLVLEYACKNVGFYKEFYNSKNYNPDCFKTLEHFQDVPIVNKDDLRGYELENRSCKVYGRTKINTGGTSGNPLAFYIDKDSFAREWAYMHHIWSKLGYSYLDLKLTFRGKNIGSKPLEYNVIHNEYLVNPYIGFESVVEAIANLSHSNTIKYIHGYPSAIYEFCKYLQLNQADVSELFKENVKGVFLGSEYPAPIYRNLIEEVLQAPTISWYGHSEFAILAYEKKPFVYCPFQTYGHAEAVSVSGTSDYRLLGTGYYNLASPFIRYDTGDLITNPVLSNGLLESFEISSGRIGDFIFDKHNHAISLTALIFGRHHNAFNKADFIQIKSTQAGKATLIVTSQDKVGLDDFDLSNVDVEFDLKLTSKPVRTGSGKLPLLIK